MLSSNGQHDTALYTERVSQALKNFFDDVGTSEVITALNGFSEHEQDVAYLRCRTTAFLAQLERIHYQFQ